MKILKGFIVFEGLDGSGTTTQTRLLHEALTERGISAVATCEPTDSPVGKLIRTVLSGKTELTPGALAHLYAADRDNHLYDPSEGILALTSHRQTVISDRYLFSSIAYQSIGTPREQVVAFNSFFPLPEILIYIDTPVSECIKRISSRGNEREIFEHEAFQSRVYEGYREVLDELPEQVKFIRADGLLPPEELHQQILEQLLQVMSIASP